MPTESRRRAPRQERARSTVDAILEATARIVDDVGLGDATTTRIARVAGVSVGSLYQYFPGKEALFGALVDRAVDADLERLDGAVDEARAMSLEEGVRHLVRAAFELPLDRPKLFAWILHYIPALGLSPSVRRLEQGGMRAMRRFFDDHANELPSGIDLDVLVLAGMGATRGALEIVARERREWLSDGRALEFAVDLFLGYVEAARARAKA